MNQTPTPEWYASYPPGVDPDLAASAPTMLDAWRHAVDSRGHRPAVFFFDQVFTFTQIDDASNSLAVAFEDLGVGPGDRVAVYLQNDPQWLVTLLAAWKRGAAVACINPMLREKELRHHLGDAAPQVLVCLDQLYSDVVSPIRKELGVDVVITTAPWDMVASAPPPTVFAEQWGDRRTFDDTFDWRDLLAKNAGHSSSPVVVEPADVALLTYTSGTTGRAKGAMNLHRGMVHSAEVFKSWFAIDPEIDVILGIAPLFHITGSVAGLALAIVSGAPVILLHRFDSSTTLEAIEFHKATFTVAASTAYNALAGHPETRNRDLSSLTKAACGGAPLSPALVDRIRQQTSWTVLGVYGLTETTSPSTICPPGRSSPVEPASGALAVGIPVPGADVVIVDDNGAPVPYGSAGEITVSGPMVVPGYWNAPEESTFAIRDGVLFTGDVGVMHEDGWLFVVDRKKDLINAGGYKIWPREVEDVLYAHPAIKEAAVVGVPDEYRGETVKAVISLHRGADTDVAEVIAFCKERMAAYKYPRIVEIIDDLPKNASGKILRRDLRAPADGSRA